MFLLLVADLLQIFHVQYQLLVLEHLLLGILLPRQLLLLRVRQQLCLYKMQQAGQELLISGIHQPHQQQDLGQQSVHQLQP